VGVFGIVGSIKVDGFLSLLLYLEARHCNIAASQLKSNSGNAPYTQPSIPHSPFLYYSTRIDNRPCVCVCACVCTQWGKSQSAQVAFVKQSNFKTTIGCVLRCV